MELSARKVKIFKIRNRKGFAAFCLDHLTEGKTPFQAYQRMVKAVKRAGYTLKEIDAARARTLVTSA